MLPHDCLVTGTQKQLKRLLKLAYNHHGFRRHTLHNRCTHLLFMGYTVHQYGNYSHDSRKVHTFEEALPLFQPTLTNEQIFTQFLKHHKKYKLSKELYSTRSATFTDTSVQVKEGLSGMFLWPTQSSSSVWGKMHIKWKELCGAFQLNGTVNYERVLRS